MTTQNGIFHNNKKYTFLGQILERKEMIRFMFLHLGNILMSAPPDGKQDSLPSHTLKLLKALIALPPISCHFRAGNPKSLNPSNSLKSIILSSFLSAVVTKDCRNILEISTEKQSLSRKVTWEMSPRQVSEVGGVRLKSQEALLAFPSPIQAHQSQDFVQAHPPGIICNL